MKRRRYIILEHTPFPGNWAPMAICFLQEAESVLFRDDPHHHNRAIRLTSDRQIDNLLAYCWDDAQSIIEYHQAVRPHARCKLLALHWQPVLR
jgi:hypothetical protein